MQNLTRGKRSEPCYVEPLFHHRAELSRQADTRILFQVVYGQSFNGVPAHDEVEYLLQPLSSSERQVIIRHYALQGGRPRSLAEIATASSSNAYSIGIIWNRALTKMQRQAQGHSPYLQLPIRAQGPTNGDHPASLPGLVKELPLSTDTRHRLLRAGITETEELLNMSPVELLAHKGIGVTTLDEVNRVLGGETSS